MSVWCIVRENKFWENNGENMMEKEVSKKVNVSKCFIFICVLVLAFLMGRYVYKMLETRQSTQTYAGAVLVDTSYRKGDAA